ncbi:flagellar export chaperone FliS [Desulfopila aestuarii]|uniref:Flagellar secretion chaperone FliS n=1 Tax=Desulfopila aestuarii DSM 18488 TaxID=1121416 RepID=A0A1M7YDR2_9BACT|nr:flagellar export chaperone FliS [Desulfopila aestuarii]SHO50780.1 flagellar protein FliS [Desulfopila aestuarii DSM 18488]
MNGYNQYQTNQIATATPEQILLMLYDGAIRFIRRAIVANDESKQVEKLQGISKCMAIVAEFSNSLNHDIGGNIAEDLDALYQFMIRELNLARNDNSGEHLKTVETLLLDLRDTWGQAVEINRQEIAVARTVQTSTADSAADMQRPYKSLMTAG